MTRTEAEERARRLQAEDPERETHRFFAREAAGGDWEVARVELPEPLRRGALTEGIEAKPKPPTPDDPRSNVGRNLPYHGI